MPAVRMKLPMVINNKVTKNERFDPQSRREASSGTYASGVSYFA